ncbi:hypothetical protein Phum_PHUM283600 [Pediculus humanus corporis]|uniref:Uncharacterized protein n=1 Tax=Pediculus humanus subsp. corporis TaxID=121224 RepID=E0VL78_PEDHC|nr:uncharacterized protein Phum_PHUM283600 [Pediculus humanus corporis]EEB14134.1 hypothetical protein Phum_PHUM283600 [Pediculus humanus corporis]
MVGKLSHNRIKTNEESYRCFVYERVQTHDRKVSYNVAQSGDATCNGLPSALEGSKVMRLTKGNIRSVTLPYTSGIRKPNSAEMRVVCHSEVKTEPQYSIVIAHVTNGCDSGYICLGFYRRDSTVIELQQSTNLVQVPDEACNQNNFDPSKLPFITLISK